MAWQPANWQRFRIEAYETKSQTTIVTMYNAYRIVRLLWKDTKLFDRYFCLPNMIFFLQRRSVDSLAFETLTPKAVVKRYVSLLLEHKRIILSGPAGTGKTFMANRLAKYLAHCNNRDSNKTVGSSSAASTPTTPTAGNFPSIADDSIMFFAVEADRDELYKKRSSRKIDSRILFSRE